MQDNFDRDLLYYKANRLDAATVAIAVILTVLIHIAILWAVPYEFEKIKAEEKPESLRLEILPPAVSKKIPEFVEANPFANDMTPLSPDSPESFKNQRAADEITDPSSKSKKPFVAGEIKDGSKIVSGTSSQEDIISPDSVMNVLNRPLQQPAQPSESSAKRQKPSDSKTDAKTEQASKSEGEQKAEDTEKKYGKEKADAASKTGEEASKNSDDPNAFLKISKRDKQAEDAAREKAEAQTQKKTAQKSEGKSAAPSSAPAPSQNPQEKQPENPAEEPLPAPKPRPTLSMKIPAGPLADNRQHASMQGVLACDSRFSEFGAYQQRMIEAISRQWNLLGSRYDLGTAVGTMVVIEFSLNPDGELTKFEILFSNSTNTGTGLCEQSIRTTAPYGGWTQEMINSLGMQDQPVRITFHYR